MRQSQTAVIERKATFTGDFATEPFEAGWAYEARWFVKVLELSDGTTLRLATQISPDGLVWTDYETMEVEAPAVGLYSWPVHHFGQWLRLRGVVDGPEASARVMIYLSLKS